MTSAAVWQEAPVCSESELQMEVERLVVTEFAKEVQAAMSRPNVLTLGGDGDSLVIGELILPQLTSKKGKLK